MKRTFANTLAQPKQILVLFAVFSILTLATMPQLSLGFATSYTDGTHPVNDCGQNWFLKLLTHATDQAGICTLGQVDNVTFTEMVSRRIKLTGATTDNEIAAAIDDTLANLERTIIDVLSKPH